MVGAALGCALGIQGVRVALLEGRAPRRSWPAGEIDHRVSALSRASQRILVRLGVWESMAGLGVSPYRAMEVWDAGGDGQIQFDSADIGEPDLGHIVENRVTQLALWQRLEGLDSVRLCCPAKPRGLVVEDRSVRLTLDSGEPLVGRLLVGADGRDSAIRQWAGIGTQGWDYDQQALVANVSHELPHQETARQRFMTSGPLAFLPLADGHASSIVWSTSPAQAKQLLEQDEAGFGADLGRAFSYRLGAIRSVGARGCFPLRLQHAERYVQPRLALVGDAAHAIHPLAGQGVNLGFLDAAVLAEVVLHALARGRDPGQLGALRRYERARKGDNLAMLAAMDGFKRLFGSDFPPLRLLRNTGLTLANALPPVKHLFMGRALGLLGELPELARP